MTQVLLVGESNTRTDNQCYALYPTPPGCAGARLCAILAMSHAQYLATFARVNLLGSRHWSSAAARVAAETLTARYRVLLGARVAAAHGLPFTPFRVVSLRPRWQGIILPHPSGRSRVWNDRSACVTARELVRALVVAASLPRAPVEWCGRQGELDLWTLTRDVQGHQRGSTVSGQTLQLLGYSLPDWRPDWAPEKKGGHSDGPV